MSEMVQNLDPLFTKVALAKLKKTINLAIVYAQLKTREANLFQFINKLEINRMQVKVLFIINHWRC